MRGKQVNKLKLIIYIVLVVAILSGIIYFFVLKPDNTQNNTNNQVTTYSEPPKELLDTFKTFSGQEFYELYSSFAYPNTQLINENAPITGNHTADIRIKELAKAKGYVIRSAPVTNTFTEVENNMFLQQKAVKPWQELKDKASAENLTLGLTAAYRSADEQKSIFLSRLQGTSVDLIAQGKADAQVSKVLETTAPPGYSRHHNGYTVDIACKNEPNVKFENSACFAWLSKDNYINAKKLGWIPSYPVGAVEQGPEPEAWEYVWVGTNPLRETR